MREEWYNSVVERDDLSFRVMVEAARVYAEMREDLSMKRPISSIVSGQVSADLLESSIRMFKTELRLRGAICADMVDGH